MRTRSQQASPGGFVSLDDERAPTRRTRATRNTTQASTEHSSQPTQAAEPPTRSKTQRTTKKATTTKRTPKNQTRKVSKRTTRTKTRKTDDSMSGDEGQESFEDVGHPKTALGDSKESSKTDPDPPGSVTSTQETTLLEPKSSERESRYFLTLSQDVDTLLDLETLEPPQNPHTSQDPPITPNIFDLFLDLPDCGDTATPAWYEWTAAEISGILALSEGSNSPPPPDYDDDELFALDDELVAELEAALALHEAQELETIQVEEEPTEVIKESSTDEGSLAPATVAINVPSTSEQAVAEPASAEPKESEEVTILQEPKQHKNVSRLASPVHSGQETAVEEDEITNKLAQLLESLSLVDTVPCLSEEAAVPLTESTTIPPTLPETAASEKEPVSAINAADENLTTLVSGASAEILPMASIYSNVPPVCPSLGTSAEILPMASIYSSVSPICPSLDVLMPAEWIQQRPPTIFGDSIPITPTSIYEHGQRPVEQPLVSVLLDEGPELIPRPIPCSYGAGPKEPHTTPPVHISKPTWVPSVLSPIPEELDADPAPYSNARRCQETTGQPPVSSTATLLPTPTLKDAHPRTPKNQKLTLKKVNRKRAHSNFSSDNQADPETPQANKRRNLGPPGSTPFARRNTPLSRRISTPTVPYSERLRRRRAESQGRIHRTVFRLPQLVAQTEADRQTSETPPLTPNLEPLQSSFDFSVDQIQADQTNQTVTDEPSTHNEPSTPKPAQRGWNIRGLFNSVPRSFSRFLPSFGRSPNRPEVSVLEPSSERVRRTQAVEADFPSVSQKRENQSGRRLSDQPPSKRARNLSYSLFPAPIDRALYLGDVPKTHSTPGAVANMSSTKETRGPDPQSSATSNTQKTLISSRDPVVQETNGNTDKKRKRSSSPDVIPNPAGSSYGMDLDYFCYSSESEDEEERPAPRTEPRKLTGTFTQDAGARNTIQSERPASKKVRFDASPEDTPSKLRTARATDPYRGKHFIGMGGPHTFSAPTTPTSTSSTSLPPQRSPGFVPNKQGTFELDYDEEDTALSPAVVLAPVTPKTITSTQSTTPESAPSTSSRQPPHQAPPPPTPQVDKEALARARSQAEKYKPKTPSGLRTTSRYSSPLTATSNTAPAEPAAHPMEKFGDDQFAEDAQWLYENCPSGDLSQLVWPAKQDLAESLNIRPSSLQLLSEIWDDSEVDRGYNAFEHSLAEFQKTLA